MNRVLVAGLGNIFYGDDGFGVEVARRLSTVPLPDDVRVRDFGIRGVHLAYELLDGYETAILVDATPRGGAPGTVYVIEPDVDLPVRDAPADAHGMDPASVLTYLRSLAGTVRVLIVGCEPADAGEGMGLSPPVSGAVDEAVRVVQALIAEARPWVGNDAPNGYRTRRTER